MEQRVSWDGTTCNVKDCNQGGHHWPDKEKFPPKGHGICEPYWLGPEVCPDKDEHYRNKYKGRLTFKYHTTRDGGSETVYIDGELVTKNYICKRCICGLYLIYEER